MADMTRRRLLAAGGGALLGVATLSRLAVAQEADWPSRPVTLVVGFAPGSGNDIIARLLARAMAPMLPQPVVVENKPGAGGSIGTGAVIRAKPDGYTLMLGTSSQLVMNVPVFTDQGFNIETDLAPVALLSRTRLVLLGKKGFPAKNIKDLIALAKERGQTLNAGSAGPGSIIHIAQEKFMRDAGIQIPIIHYRGSGPAFQALLAGEIDVLVDGARNGGQYIKSGDVVGIAMSDERSPLIPDLPTFKEQGLNHSDSYTWNSIMAPLGTPRPIIDKLNKVVNDALKTKLLTDYLQEADSTNLVGSTPETTDAFWRNELKIWVPLIKEMNLKRN